MVNFDVQRSPKVKSEVALFLKITLLMCRNHVPSFMLLSQNAQLSIKSALLLVMCEGKKEKRTTTKLNFSHSMFLTMRRVNGTLGVHFTIE